MSPKKTKKSMSKAMRAEMYDEMPMKKDMMNFKKKSEKSRKKRK